MSKRSYKEGESVSWSWGNGEGEGKIKIKNEETVSWKINGAKITRKGSKSDPAYYIEIDDGSNVLKLGSELV